MAVGSLKLSALLFASHALHVSARHEKGCAPLCGMRKVFLRNVRARPCYKVRLRRESLRGTRTALPARSVPAGPSARLYANECARFPPPIRPGLGLQARRHIQRAGRDRFCTASCGKLLCLICSTLRSA